MKSSSFSPASALIGAGSAVALGLLFSAQVGAVAVQPVDGAKPIANVNILGVIETRPAPEATVELSLQAEYIPSIGGAPLPTVQHLYTVPRGKRAYLFEAKYDKGNGQLRLYSPDTDGGSSLYEDGTSPPGLDLIYQINSPTPPNSAASSLSLTLSRSWGPGEKVFATFHSETSAAPWPVGVLVLALRNDSSL